MKAEIIQNLYLVDHNQGFSSGNNDNSCFKRVFPNSNTACGYSQSETKAKYMIQFGIAPYVFEKLSEDIHGKPFSFQFDETSTQQVKKQYDEYISIYFSTHKKIATEYCGLLFVCHCTLDDLVNHFFEFMEKLKLNLLLLLVLGMDGPSVNRSFEKKLKAGLEENYATQILDIGTCSLHIVNSAFLEGLKEL